MFPNFTCVVFICPTVYLESVLLNSHIFEEFLDILLLLNTSDNILCVFFNPLKLIEACFMFFLYNLMISVFHI